MIIFFIGPRMILDRGEYSHRHYKIHVRCESGLNSRLVQQRLTIKIKRCPTTP